VKRVLLFSETQSWCGAAAQQLALAKGLAAAQWEVRVASPEHGELAKRAAAAGFIHLPINPQQDHDLSVACRLAQSIQEGGIDVLHAHQPRAHAVSLAALAILSGAGPAFIVTRRLPLGTAKQGHNSLKFRNPRVNGFIAVSEAIRRELLEAGVAPEKVVTIPNGVDIATFQPVAKDEELLRELAIPDGVPVIGKITHFNDWKGQPIVIEAAARMAAEGRRAVFLFAGRGTDSEEMKSRVRKAGLPEESVRLLGFRNDVPRVLSVCDVSVSAATRGDCIAGAVRESLAMRIPVVVSDTPGNVELIQEGRTGRTFAAGSATDLTRVLGETLDDTVAARFQALEGCKLVRERYSNERLVEATLDFYQKTLARKSAPAKDPQR